jgi:hypothetical protein
MSRAGFVVAAATAVMSVLLGSCSSGMPDWMPSMPDWMSSSSSSPALQNLSFATDPPGADVRTVQGQTCITPCTLSVPSQEQPVTVSKVGFVPQTVQVSLGPPPEHSFWESPPPTLVPNPVQVVLQPVPPPPRTFHRRRPRRKTISRRLSRTRTAAKTAPRGNPFPDPPQMQPSSSPFPPPPQMEQPAASPFPPPPSTR